MIGQLQEKIRPVAQGVERPVGLFPATGLGAQKKFNFELLLGSVLTLELRAPQEELWEIGMNDG